jgi:hypothetical protein
MYMSQESLVMDCAGFNDSRGPEVNIANSVIIKTCVGEASGVVTVILVNYHTLKSGRGRGLSELLELILGLFGTLDRVLAHKKSVLIGVSQVHGLLSHFSFPSEYTHLLCFFYCFFIENA